MAIYKRCSRCNKRMLTGTRCSCYKERHKEYKKYRTDIREQRLYSSKDWESIKDKVKSIYKGIDIYSYYIQETIEEGQTVHHIEPVKDNWNRRFDISNLILLTESNHKYIHRLMDKSKEDKNSIQKLLYSLVERYYEENNI